MESSRLVIQRPRKPIEVLGSSSHQKLISDPLKLKSTLKSWISTNPAELEVLAAYLQIMCQLELRSKWVRPFHNLSSARFGSSEVLQSSSITCSVLSSKSHKSLSKLAFLLQLNWSAWSSFSVDKFFTWLLWHLLSAFLKAPKYHLSAWQHVGLKPEGGAARSYSHWKLVQKSLVWTADEESHRLLQSQHDQTIEVRVL